MERNAVKGIDDFLYGGELWQHHRRGEPQYGEFMNQKYLRFECILYFRIIYDQLLDKRKVAENIFGMDIILVIKIISKSERTNTFGQSCIFIAQI